jgi:hypothetical protein
MKLYNNDYYEYLMYDLGELGAYVSFNVNSTIKNDIDIKKLSNDELLTFWRETEMSPFLCINIKYQFVNDKKELDVISYLDYVINMLYSGDYQQFF